jgi:hypothetical protein
MQPPPQMFQPGGVMDQPGMMPPPAQAQNPGVGDVPPHFGGGNAYSNPFSNLLDDVFKYSEIGGGDGRPKTPLAGMDPQNNGNIVNNGNGEEDDEMDEFEKRLNNLKKL